MTTKGTVMDTVKKEVSMTQWNGIIADACGEWPYTEVAV